MPPAPKATGLPQPVHGRDRHLAAAGALQMLDAQFNPLVVLERLAHMRDQQLPDRGEPQALRQAMKNLGAEAVLELQDLPVDGGRRNIQPPRGRPDRATARYFVEVAKRSCV